MLLAVGSTNQAKVLAVEEVARESSRLKLARIVAMSVESDVSEQPLTLQETIQGAKNRAKNAFDQCGLGCSFGFGIESGLMEAPGTATGFFNVCVCAIYNGTNWHTGLSCGFETPPEILALVREKKMDLSQACIASGITTNPDIGTTEGLIGILTRGRIDRKEYSKQALLAAIVQLDHSSWY